jgi:hypothetical protein
MSLGHPIAVAALAVSQIVGPVVGPMREAPEARLQRLLEQRIGAPAVVCAQFLLHESGKPAASAAGLQNSIECVLRHAGARTPAWLVVQHQGLDSWVAEGVFTDSTGAVQYYSYDSDPSGGSGAAPRLTASACPRPRVGADSPLGVFLSCVTPQAD